MIDPTDSSKLIVTDKNPGARAFYEVARHPKDFSLTELRSRLVQSNDAIESFLYEIAWYIGQGCREPVGDNLPQGSSLVGKNAIAEF